MAQGRAPKVIADDRRARNTERKQARIQAQRDREAANRRRAQEGELTPWQAACMLRAERRVPLRAAWQRRQRKEQLPAS